MNWRKLLIGCGVAVATLALLGAIALKAFDIWIGRSVRAQMSSVGLTHDPAEQAKAIADLSEQIRANPKDAALYAKWSAAYISSQHSDLAFADLTTATSLDPGNWGYWNLKAIACEMCGRRAEAVEAYHRVLDLDSPPTDEEGAAAVERAHRGLQRLSESEKG